MSRLTKKIFNSVEGYAVNNVPNESDGIYYVSHNVINKLGKLEDLKEELGCPLEVFKALMLGITVKNNDDLIDSDYADKEEKYVNFSPDEIYIKNYPSYGLNNSITHSIEIVFGVDGEWSVYLKDYQKTWWLRGER